jgi:hypothetical protein
MKRQSPKEARKEESRNELLEILKPGDTVFCILRHVSRSGMQREISLFTEGMRDITYHASIVLQDRIGKRDGIVVGGCGMDMGFALVYNLSRCLFPNGFGIKCESDGCTYRPATKEEATTCNNGLREGITPHTFYGRNGDKSGWDNDGGYALKHRWL